MIFSKIYKIITYMLFPVIWLHLQKRIKKGKEDKERFGERKGFPSAKRKDGFLVWLHGASVGESISMLPLIEHLQGNYENINILITTGTRTSADLLKNKLKGNAIHQYMPVDYMPYVKRFIKHWQPDLCLWFESEFWPNTISKLNEKNVPILLINGRISDKTFKNWLKIKPFIKEMLSSFDYCLGQSEQDEERLKTLGAKNTKCLGNMKFAAKPLKADEKELKNLKSQTKDRLLFLASSTHYDEEERIAKIHLKLKKDYKNILTIIVPRHPQRGEDIQQSIISMGLETSLRSKNQKIKEQTDIYIANTIGELGIFYNLCEVVFIGGSLIPHGGQNFLEPAKLNSAIIVGKNMQNFAQMTEKALVQNAIVKVENEKEFLLTIKNIYNDKEKRQDLIKNALDFANHEQQVLDRVVEFIKPFLKKRKKLNL